jgi:CyaY protein
MNMPQSPKQSIGHAVSESDFNDHVDKVLACVEAAIDQADTDIDSELNGGILTLTFANDTKVIINRQTPMREIWVAAKSGGFHFRFDGAAWLDTRSNEALDALLSRVMSAQSESVIEITL